MKSTVLITMLLVLTSATQAAVEPTCFGGKYEPGSRQESNVHAVLDSILANTVNAPNRQLTVRMESPDVFGYSSCDLGLPEGDCSYCISVGVSSIRDRCNGYVGASVDEEGFCHAQYN
ncbi:antifungal protein ginkbilobin-2-like [Asparagus officinalis]|uniref:antifungal protein ginkbilobin-2-like n=1 Tax=Asparagus officinalis TaxID=4686 RepID=UPI00098E1707|nr:antifungal protein ginkbilobin-2-like [Asparagus officinalis]